MRSRCTLAILTTLLLGLTACKTGSSPEPESTTDVLESPAEPATPDAPPAFMKGLAENDYLAIVAAAGCDEATLDAPECIVCPNNEYVAIDVLPGDFVAPGRPGAVVVSPVCPAEAGATPTMRLTLVERGEDGAWAKYGTADVTHLTRCSTAEERSGRDHLLCASEMERYGTTSTYHAHVDWRSGSTEPIRTTLVEVAERESCELNYSVAHEITPPRFDASDDGSVLVLDVTTTMGPFTKPLDACADGTFEGPLRPERASKTLENTFTFELTDDGPRERDGKGSYVSLGKEFEELMEQ